MKQKNNECLQSTNNHQQIQCAGGREGRFVMKKMRMNMKMNRSDENNVFSRAVEKTL